MSNLPRLPNDFPVSPPSESRDALIHRRVEDYLDYLCAPLLGVVPYHQRLRLRQEAQDHLLLLIEDFAGDGAVSDGAVSDGATPAQIIEAIDKALAQYGEPYQIGQEWVEAWVDRMDHDCCRFHRIGSLQRISPLTLRAFGWFGVLTVTTVLLIERQLLDGYRDNLSFLTPGLCLISPIIAGAATGTNFHPRTAFHVCRAFLPLLLFTTVTGCLLLPKWDLLLFALVQCLYWLPAGCLSASATAYLRRQCRIQRYRTTTC